VPKSRINKNELSTLKNIQTKDVQTKTKFDFQWMRMRNSWDEYKEEGKRGGILHRKTKYGRKIMSGKTIMTGGRKSLHERG
jgi:hypothetical protein